MLFAVKFYKNRVVRGDPKVGKMNFIHFMHNFLKSARQIKINA